MMFLVGMLAGSVLTTILFSVALIKRHRRNRRINPGDAIMAIRAEIQAQLDRLAAVPGAIEAAKSAAVQAAVAQSEADHAEEVAALATATDAVVATATNSVVAAPTDAVVATATDAVVAASTPQG